MTRKDYVLIADTIAQLSRDIAHDEGCALSDTGRAVASGERAATSTLAHRLAHELQRDNPRFDQQRFIEACQLDAERLA
jgi:deoxycytidylate deaminase